MFCSRMNRHASGPCGCNAAAQPAPAVALLVDSQGQYDTFLVEQMRLGKVPYCRIAVAAAVAVVC